MAIHLLNKLFLWAVALLTLPAMGQTVWDGDIDVGWYGEQGEGPYHISTAAELAGLAKLVNEGNTFYDKTIYLDSDIQLNDTENWESWGTTAPTNEWTAIGTEYNFHPFRGTFDGQGHTISGIYINNNSSQQGLFGYVNNGGTVKNLSVMDSYIKAEDFVGGIIGWNNGGTVSDCSYSGTVTGTASSVYVGGIAGINSSSGTVSNCSNSGTVTGTASGTYVGGIVGYNQSSGTVSNCSNSGTVTGTASSVYVGGIAGGNSSSGTVSKCYFLEKEGLQGVGDDGETVPSDDEMKKSPDEYASGAVARLLDETGTVWGQDIDNGFPVPLGCLSEADRAACKIYTVTLNYGEATETLYGNSDTPITPPAAPEGFIYTWNPALPATFGEVTDVTTFTATLVEEELEEPTEPEEPDVPQITYYDVRFVQPNDSVSFQYRSDQVREGNTFSFSASAAEGYDPRTLVVEYRRGPVGIWREVDLDSDGKYHVRSNYADLYIRARVEPLVPTGIEAVGDEAIEVRTEGDAIRVYTPDKARVVIVTTGGKLVRLEEQAGIRRYTGLSDGVYIVRIGERSWKVRL